MKKDYEAPQLQIVTFQQTDKLAADGSFSVETESYEG